MIGDMVLIKFFWQHLPKTAATESTVAGKSMDDVVIFLSVKRLKKLIIIIFFYFNLYNQKYNI